MGGSPAMLRLMAIRPTPVPTLPVATSQGFVTAYPEVVQEVRRLRSYRDREFAKLPSLSSRERHSRTRKLIRLPSMHRLYAYEGLKKAGTLNAATPDRLNEVAEQCNPLQPCHERSTVKLVGSGARRRYVEVFGPAKRGRQMMVADLLRFLHPPLEYQYMFRGGMPAAFDAVEAAYADGFTWGTETDLVGFYPSVRLEGLADLLRPLPESVVNHVVWDRTSGDDDVSNDVVPVSMQWAYPPPGVQLGIALGSACSPMVAETILAVLIAPTHDCQTIAYSDNVFVMGRSEEAVVACVQAMRGRVERLGHWASGLRMRDDGPKAA